MLGIISTKGISGAGLKKCNPPKRSGCFSALEIAATLKLEVFVHKRARSETRSSTSANNVFLIARSSITASMTRSAPSTILSDSDQFMRPITSALTASVIRPFSTSLWNTLSIEALLRSTAPG